MPSRELLKKAESGDANAMYDYALEYMELAKSRDNYDEDRDVIMHWIRKAAENGHAKAQRDLAGILREDNPKESFDWLQKAANQGEPEAQHNLAVYYEQGIGTPMDYNKQFYWYEKAAQNGDIDAKHMVGVCYILGEGTAPDFEKAAYWLKQAASEGYAKSKTRLASMYAQGYGVPEDKEKAISLLREAANQGDEKAIALLAEDGIPQSPKKGGGCYIATCVYGSYRCPEVMMLRRFRDNVLCRSWVGRAFVRVYYSTSPMIVRIFGKQRWFHGILKPVLDKLVKHLS
jgi:hypothetical protein